MPVIAKVSLKFMINSSSISTGIRWEDITKWATDGKQRKETTGKTLIIPEAYLEHYQTSTIEILSKIVNGFKQNSPS